MEKAEHGLVVIQNNNNNWSMRYILVERCVWWADQRTECVDSEGNVNFAVNLNTAPIWSKLK